MSTARSHTQVPTHHLGRLLPLNMSCNINTVCCSVTLIICMLLLVIHMLVVAMVSLLCGFFRQVFKQIVLFFLSLPNLSYFLLLLFCPPVLSVVILISQNKKILIKHDIIAKGVVVYLRNKDLFFGLLTAH